MSGINLRLQIEGVDELMHRLSRVLAADTRAGPMRRLQQALAYRLSLYPPETGGTYERTGTLGRAWADEAGQGGVHVDAIGSNQFADQISIELKNTTSYAPWVQDPVMQARIHRGRWETTQQAIDAETGPFMSDLTQTVDKALGPH